MAVHYIDPTNGTDSSNPIGTEANPRRTPPAQTDHAVWRFKRGSQWDRTTQLGITSQGMVICDYGPPEAPRPVFRSIQSEGSASFLTYGDTLWANINFDLIDRTETETSASTVGQNCVSHGRRGSGVSPTQAVSGVYVGCGFNRIGGNAINASPLSSDTDYDQASPVLMVLGCDFDTIGNDGMYCSVSQYLEVAHCTGVNFSTRADSNSDFINTIFCAPEMVWIHDNVVNRSSDDKKHIVMLDLASGQAGGLAIIERNTFLVYGSVSPYPQASVNAGLNLEMRSIVRQNYIRGSRLLVRIAQPVTGSEIHSNILDYTGGGTTAAVVIEQAFSDFSNNTVVSRNRAPGARGVLYSGAANNSRNSRNVYVGLDRAIEGGFRDRITGGDNRFASCAVRYSNNAGAAMTDGAGDLVIQESSLITEYGIPVRPAPGALTDTMARLDRRIPDFWGRFAPEGIGYIGALMEEGL